jgi:hypothetical protein
MTWTELSSLISALSGVAVLVSLIFALLQLQVAVKNQQAMIRTFRTGRLVELNMAAANPSFADAWFKGSHPSRPFLWERRPLLRLGN